MATVWDYTADSEYVGVYMPWYPGDEYVDWWAVNVFGSFDTPDSVPSNAGIGSPYIIDFMLAAANKSYPVMIGESAPRGIGGNTMPCGCAAKNAWNDWYQPYFEMINNSSYNIRAFCYINADNPPWCEAEINECPNVGPKYQQTLSQNQGPYANVMDEESTKKLFGLN